MNVEQIFIYISAGSDLAVEREALAQILTEIPTSLGWRVVQSGRADETVNELAVATADLHFLLLGQDIRAPIGVEWQMARNAGRTPIPLRKTVAHTPAAQAFKRFIGSQIQWKSYDSIHALRVQFSQQIIEHILRNHGHYQPTMLEIDRLTVWLNQLKKRDSGDIIVDGGAGASGVILSHEQVAAIDGVDFEAKAKVERAERRELNEAKKFFGA